MFNIIELYIKRLTKEDVKNFAIKKNINLTDQELDFTYDFLKKNYKDYFKNPKLFDINRYANNYDKDTFIKIKKVYEEYTKKYANYL